MTQEVVDRLLVRTQRRIFTMEPPVALFSGAIQDPQGDLENHSIFKLVSKAEKLRKPATKASKKHQKSTLESQIRRPLEEGPPGCEGFPRSFSWLLRCNEGMSQPWFFVFS